MTSDARITAGRPYPMGATLDAEGYEPGARRLAGLLRDDGVDAVLLSPV